MLNPKSNRVVAGQDMRLLPEGDGSWGLQYAGKDGICPRSTLTDIDRVGDLWRESGLIFASESGEPLDRRYFATHRFKPLLKRMGLPQIRFHDLRHTCATLLLSMNANPNIVSEMLGHASIAITLDTYAHVLPAMQDSDAKAMEEALT